MGGKTHVERDRQTEPEEARTILSGIAKPNHRRQAMLSGIAKTEPGGKSNVERYRQTELEQRDRQTEPWEEPGARKLSGIAQSRRSLEARCGSARGHSTFDVSFSGYFKTPKKFPGRPYRAGRAEPRLLGKAPRA